MAVQPGVVDHGRILRSGVPWLTMVAEHHLESGLGVDLMGCTLDPWQSPGLPAPTNGLRDTAPVLFWHEWDLVARGPDDPLWSVSYEPMLLDAAARPVAHERWRPGLGTLASTEVCARVFGVLRRLGVSGVLLHVAPLWARGREGLRLSSWVRADAVVGWLESVGHPAIPSDLASVLVGLSPPHGRVGVQLEVGEDGLRAYLGLESPVLYEGGRAPSFAAAVLPAAGTPGHDRWSALRGWVEDGRGGGVRRQLYVKLTAGPQWSTKAYAGVTSVI